MKNKKEIEFCQIAKAEGNYNITRCWIQHDKYHIVVPKWFLIKINIHIIASYDLARCALNMNYIFPFFSTTCADYMFIDMQLFQEIFTSNWQQFYRIETTRMWLIENCPKLSYDINLSVAWKLMTKLQSEEGQPLHLQLLA